MAQVCGACGQSWTGEKCGQVENGWPFQTCYPIDVPAPTMSEEERHAIAHARYQVEHASPDNPECCFDYELVRDLLRVIDRASVPASPKLRTAAEVVVSTFEKDETQGYRSKDRQFAIDILKTALSEQHEVKK